MANWPLGKRFAPELAITIVRHYLCLNDHYAKLCKSVGDCSCNSLTSSPKTLERIWCEQEDGPVGSLFFRMSPDLFLSLFAGKGLIEQVLASCQVPSSTILAHVMEGPVHGLQT